LFVNASAEIVGTAAELDVDVAAGVLDVAAGVLDAVVDALLAFELFEFELPHAATARQAAIAKAAVPALPFSKCTIGLLFRLV
jgi:hypothetical protein